MQFHFISYGLSTGTKSGDLEWHNGHYFELFTDLGINYVTVVEVRPYCLQQKFWPKESSFWQRMIYDDMIYGKKK